jgi:hypothetical protein
MVHAPLFICTSGLATFTAFFNTLIMMGVLLTDKFDHWVATVSRFVMWGCTICAFSSTVLDVNAVRIGNDVCVENSVGGVVVFELKDECMPGIFIGMVFGMIFVTSMNILSARLYAEACTKEAGKTSNPPDVEITGTAEM